MELTTCVAASKGRPSSCASPMRPMWFEYLAGTNRDRPVYLVLEFGDAAVTELVVGHDQLLARLQELLRRPCHGVVLAALCFDLHEERDVIEQDERARELRPLLFTPRVAVDEVTKEG